MIPDGVYIRMPFDEYAADDALGSTHKATLWRKGRGFWWRYLSPHRPKVKSTEAQIFGQGLHAACLEGLHEYESRFIVKPERDDYGDELLTSADAVKKRLRELKINVGPTGSFVAEDWYDLADLHLPDTPVWPVIMDEFNRRAPGRQQLSAFDDYAIRAMRDLALSEEHSTQDMRDLLSVGSEFPILAEISIFYTDADGIRHRARFDKLLPVVTADMKSVGERRGRPLSETLHDHITDMGYDVQLADYHVARQAMNRMLLEDPERYLHGGTQEERDHLEHMAYWNVERQNQWGWCWIFFQKPTPAGDAPILFPLRDPWKGPYHLAGFRKRHAGLELYKRCMREFGPDRPWGHVEPIHYVDEGAEHHIEVHQHGWGPQDPAPDEEAHFQTPDYEPRRTVIGGDHLA